MSVPRSPSEPRMKASIILRISFPDKRDGVIMIYRPFFNQNLSWTLLSFDGGTSGFFPGFLVLQVEEPNQADGIAHV